MDDLENKVEDTSVVGTETLSNNQEGGDSPQAEPEGTDQKTEEAELTDEQLKEEIELLKEKASKEDDPKAKRHIEQEAGWKIKIVKEREKAKLLEEENNKKLQEIQSYEKIAIEEAFEKAIDDNYGLPYFEKLYETNPNFAEKLAQSKWQKSAKDLIFDTKKQLANNGGDEDLKKQVNEEEIRMSEREKIYHEIALEQASNIFSTLPEDKQKQAKAFFDDISEGKKLNLDKAKIYAEMAVTYVNRGNPDPTPKQPVDKQKLMGDFASTGKGIGSPIDGPTQVTTDVQAIRQQLLHSGVNPYMVDLMYPLK